MKNPSPLHRAIGHLLIARTVGCLVLAAATLGLPCWGAASADPSVGLAATRAGSNAVRVYCQPLSGGDPVVASVAPKTCGLEGRGIQYDALASFNGIEDARWARWGGAETVTTRARLVNNHPLNGPTSFAVRVELLRPTVGCQGRTFYSEAVVATQYGTSRFPLPTECSPPGN